MGYNDINPNLIQPNDIIVFHVPWCSHCINFEQTFSLLQKSFDALKKNYRVVSVNLEKFPDVDIKYTGGKKILSVPKLVVMHNGFSCEYKKRFTTMSAPEIAKDLSGGGCGLVGGEVSSSAPVAVESVPVEIQGGSVDIEGGKKRMHRRRMHKSKSRSRSRSRKSKSPKRKHSRHRMRGGASEGAAGLEGGAVESGAVEGGAVVEAVAVEGGEVAASQEIVGGEVEIEGGKKRRKHHSKKRSHSRSRSRSPHRALSKWRKAIKMTLGEYRIPRKGTSAYRRVRAAYDRM